MTATYIDFCKDILQTIQVLVEKEGFTSQEQIPTFCATLRDFYLSLFDDEGGNGFFPVTDMNSALEQIPDACIPRDPPATLRAPRTPPTLPQSPPPNRSPARARRGIGKGRPGIARKVQVTDRAKRKRKQTDTERNKRQRILACPEEAPPTSTLSEERNVIVPDEEPGVLHLRIRKDSREKKVAMFQDIVGGAVEEVTKEELALFFNEMCQWTQLDDDGKAYAKLLREKALRDASDATSDQLLDTMVYLKSVASGIANAASRAVGEIINKASQDNSQTTYETIHSIIKKVDERLYANYRRLLEGCQACAQCDATIEWDIEYLRYYANDERAIPPPNKGQRPMHCRRVNPQVCSMKSTMAGFSETALLRDRNFCAACMKDSPPVYSLALPTDVQTTSIKYLKPFLQSWVEGDPLPPSFVVNCLGEAPQNPNNLLQLNKESVVFFDGDGGEVRRCPETLATHGGVMRFRTTYNDAPEAFSAFRFYRKTTDGRLTPLYTYHAGIESLRAARRTIACCAQVFLELGNDSLPPTPDRYRRRLVSLWVRQENQGPLTALPVIMARQGFTHEIPTSSERNVQSAVKAASETRSGLRHLPPECMQYPYRPWDVRKLWQNPQHAPEQYRTEFKIQSLPAGLESGAEDPEQDAGGQHSFYCKLVYSPLVAESYCYAAPSTIPGAGRGLFIRPRERGIPKNTHLCLYERQPTSAREIDESGSSRIYAVQVAHATWFDAELDTGENIGRFANQSHLRETLDLAAHQADRRTFQSMDWKTVNDYARSKANAHYHCPPRENQLVIRSAQEFPPSSTPIEVFTCYADIQAYWLPLISSQPHMFPPELTEPVEFLLQSEWSNLTEQERVAFSGVVLQR